MSAVGKAIRSLKSYAQDFIIEHWVSIWIVSAGAVMTYLAAVSAYISQFGPLAWGAIGVLAVLILSLAFALTAVGYRLKIKNKYDERLLEQGSLINPLDKIFERKRIFLNDFVLPSHVLIQEKTFVDCDLIGPANIYFRVGNQAQPIRPPNVDLIWLSPTAQFLNGFIFDNCVFRNCSFQRVTMYVGLENYEGWKGHPLLNEISIAPTEEQLLERRRLLSPEPIEPELPGIPPKGTEPKGPE